MIDPVRAETAEFVQLHLKSIEEIMEQNDKEISFHFMKASRLFTVCFMTRVSSYSINELIF